VQRKIETLQDAAKAGDVEAAKKLLAEGADVDGKDDRGITPLGVAVGFNKIPIIKEFLEAGPNVEVTDPKGNTALHYAAGNSSAPPWTHLPTKCGPPKAPNAFLMKIIW
jgi:ankyrin repeat protein